MISIPLAAECGDSHEGARACYDSVPDRHVTAANTGVALQLCEDRGYAGVRWPIRATVRPIDSARRLTALQANSEALIHQGKTHLHRVVMPFSTVSLCTDNKPTPYLKCSDISHLCDKSTKKVKTDSDGRRRCVCRFSQILR